MYFPLMASVYYAQYIWLPSGEVLQNGAFRVEGTRITDVGSRSSIPRKPEDRAVNLGSLLVLPGLINMHTHLEEQFIRGIGRDAEEPFGTWHSKRMSRIRQASLDTMLRCVELGVRELMSMGCTTVVDCGVRDSHLPVITESPIRAWLVRAYTGDIEVTTGRLASDAHVKQQIVQGVSRIHLGAAPYALFSLDPEAHRNLYLHARQRRHLYSTHCAESAEELMAFAEQKGDLYFQITRKRSWSYGATLHGSLRYGLDAGILPNGSTLVHANYVGTPELEELAAKDISICICPQYSTAMEHKEFPLDAALSRNVNICLGTEGTAIVPSSNMFDEFFALKNMHPHVTSEQLLNMATVNPARALGMAGELGCIAPGALADVIAVKVSHDSPEFLLDAMIESDPDVRLVMIDGEEVIAGY